MPADPSRIQMENDVKSIFSRVQWILVIVKWTEASEINKLSFWKSLPI